MPGTQHTHSVQSMLFERGLGNEAHFPEAPMTPQDEHSQATSLFIRKCHLLDKRVIAA